MNKPGKFIINQNNRYAFKLGMLRKQLGATAPHAGDFPRVNQIAKFAKTLFKYLFSQRDSNPSKITDDMRAVALDLTRIIRAGKTRGEPDPRLTYRQLLSGKPLEGVLGTVTPEEVQQIRFYRKLRKRAGIYFFDNPFVLLAGNAGKILHSPLVGQTRPLVIAYLALTGQKVKDFSGVKSKTHAKFASITEQPVRFRQILLD